MDREIEDTLTRELHQVADGVAIPPMPQLPALPSRRPVWQPMLVAAVAVLIALAVVATITGLGGERRIVPAPSPPPSSAVELASTPTTVPHLVGEDLYVAGEQVPGRWSHVRGTETGWVALRADASWWWGYDPEPQRLQGRMLQPPETSPNGSYLARVTTGPGQDLLIGSDTEFGGEGFGGVPTPAETNGFATIVPAVTDDGMVLARGADFTTLWNPLVDGSVLQLGETAPGQQVIGNTAAGVVMVAGDETAIDGTQGETYLADISPEGEVTRGRDLPNFDDLIASEAWLAWIEPGTLGGEVASAGEMRVQRLDGGGDGVIAPPEGWSFRPFSWRWEDEDHLVATVRNDEQEERMVRCSPVVERCVLLDTP